MLLQDIGLKPTQMKAVIRRAKKAGKTATEYVRSLVERDLNAGDSFDEILKPIRDGFKKSGVTGDELDEMVNRARMARQKRPRRRAGRSFETS